MSATLTVDPKKYTRLANRVVVKAIETEDEYDRMVAAVERLIPQRRRQSVTRGGCTPRNHCNLDSGLR